MAHVDFDSVKNYYQSLVVQQIIKSYGDSEMASTEGALEDIACLALNQLPPRYVRHSIDTAFYLSIEEQQEMVRAVELAVERAVEYVSDNPRLPLGTELPIGEI